MYLFNYLRNLLFEVSCPFKKLEVSTNFTTAVGNFKYETQKVYIKIKIFHLPIF